MGTIHGANTKLGKGELGSQCHCFSVLQPSSCDSSKLKIFQRAYISTIACFIHHHSFNKKHRSTRTPPASPQTNVGICNILLNCYACAAIKKIYRSWCMGLRECTTGFIHTIASALGTKHLPYIHLPRGRRSYTFFHRIRVKGWMNSSKGGLYYEKGPQSYKTCPCNNCLCNILHVICRPHAKPPPSLATSANEPKLATTPHRPFWDQICVGWLKNPLRAFQKNRQKDSVGWYFADNSGVRMWIRTGKAPAKYVTLQNASPTSDQATNWPYLNFIVGILCFGLQLW